MINPHISHHSHSNIYICINCIYIYINILLKPWLSGFTRWFLGQWSWVQNGIDLVSLCIIQFQLFGINVSVRFPDNCLGCLPPVLCHLPFQVYTGGVSTFGGFPSNRGLTSLGCHECERLCFSYWLVDRQKGLLRRKRGHSRLTVFRYPTCIFHRTVLFGDV